MTPTKQPDEAAEQKASAAAEALLQEEDAAKAACQRKQERAHKKKAKKPMPSKRLPAGCSMASSEEALAGQLSSNLLFVKFASLLRRSQCALADKCKMVQQRSAF